MRNTLLTPTDVVFFGDLKVPFSPCSFRDLYQIEFYEARECLGFELWQNMVAALADYSAAPEYTGGTTYAAGEVVSYRGQYRRAKVETSALPSLVSDWEAAPRFAGACAEAYDALFCNFLASYLAKSVIAAKLPYIVSQIGDNGINYGGRSYSAADLEQIDGLKGTVYRDRRVAWSNMVFYLSLEENAGNACFDGWALSEENQEDCKCNGKGCKACNGSRQKIGLYDFG